jgi:hypothetical protein
LVNQNQGIFCKYYPILWRYTEYFQNSTFL